MVTGGSVASRLGRPAPLHGTVTPLVAEKVNGDSTGRMRCVGAAGEERTLLTERCARGGIVLLTHKKAFKVRKWNAGSA